MPLPKKILIGSPHPWDNPHLRAGDHYYAELFAKDGWNVFWVSHHVSLLHLFRKQHRERLKDAFRGVRQTDGVLHYTPFTLLPYFKPFPFRTVWAGKYHLRFAIPPIKKELESRDFTDVDLLLLGDMSLSYLTKIVRYKKFALRIVDDLGGLPSTPKSLVALQHMLTKKADHIFVTSPELMKYNAHHQKNFWYLPNAVDIEYFDRSLPLPEEYRKIPSPRVLFVGSIFQWVDVDLIAAAAKALPSYNFVVIGTASISLKPLKNKTNVFLLGPKSHNDVPAYMKHADVGIIPFRTEQTIPLVKSISPMKLFEYLASGLPVVCITMERLQEMKPPVRFAKDAQEFIVGIQEAFRNRKNHPEFLEFARKNTWAARYKEMLHILDI